MPKGNVSISEQQHGQANSAGTATTAGPDAPAGCDTPGAHVVTEHPHAAVDPVTLQAADAAFQTKNQPVAGVSVKPRKVPRIAAVTTGAPA